MHFQFTEREMGIAEVISKRLPTWWREDAYNCALEAIWRCRSSWNGEGNYHGWAYEKAYFYCVDELRKDEGRKDSLKNKAIKRQTQLEYQYRNDEENIRWSWLIDNDTPEHYVVDMDVNLCHLTSRWTPIQKSIIAGLVTGRLKQEIAEELGITPGRISQLIRPVKEMYEAKDSSCY